MNNITERLFRDSLIKSNPEIMLLHSSKEQDMFDHYDFVIRKYIDMLNYNETKIDVKGAKRLRRSDSKPNYDIIYVELKNVRGDKGWLLGKADLIAFELEDKFILVDRKKLLQRTYEKIKYHYQSTPQPYYLYNRRDRKDVLTLLLLDDIKDIIEWELPKADDA